MAPVQTPWTSILLQEKPILHEYNHALANIEKYYTRLHRAMQDESIHDQLVLNPDQTHSRLLKSFEILRGKQLPGPVVEEIFKTMVLRFIDDNIFSPPQIVQLVGSALPLITRQPSLFLRDLVDTLLASEDLFDHLVVNGKYTGVLKEWLISKRNSLSLALSRRVGDRLVDMCNACSADHGTGATAESWSMAKGLISSINLLVDQQELNRVKIENLPPLELMKALTLDDKKSTSTHQGPKKDFKVSEEILRQLNHFNIQPPKSARGLAQVVEQLETEVVPALMRSALESFPCRICLDRLTSGNITDTLANLIDLPSDRTTAPGSAQEIFGKRVGLWKVLLSDVAFKNAKKLVRAGKFYSVLSVL